ncbi:MAG: PEP-CTERM sorting domain-containing protein [Candidatus Hydrogenedentes bacterium]|nr:PEP-CTERM sorting domain-containing protein [Candidatus Hydrogenedentota bacterium]
MRTSHSHLSILLIAGACLAPAGVTDSLSPATFDEYVGIGGFSSSGSDPSIAEYVDLTVSPEDWADRGGGAGFAEAGDTLPVTAEAVLDLVGGANLSGIGGTAAVLSRYYFTIEELDPGTPDIVPIIFSAFGSVSVDSNQPVGWTFARITTNIVGQLQVDNNDGFGYTTGYWEQEWDIPVNATVGQEYRIDLYAYTHGHGAGEDYFFDSRTFIDPMVFFDPNFALRDQYRIAYSSGIVEVAPVPEPSTILLVFAGISCLSVRKVRQTRMCRRSAS